MDILTDSMLQINYESMRSRGDSLPQLRSLNAVKPPFTHRTLSAFGDLLCRAGTHLKEYSYKRLNSEEASAPTFLIML